jgi:hypothetical protein
MQLFVEQFVTVVLLATGLSHAVQPSRWAALFGDLLPRPYAALYIGTFTLPLGLFIVLTHNVWVLGLPVVFTVIGWGWTFKGLLYLLWPQSLERWRDQAAGPRARFNFVLVGSLMTGLGLVLAWHAFLRPDTFAGS